MERVILSTVLLLEDGLFERRTVTQQEAMDWVQTHNPKNFCGHQTVRLLGLQPATTREACRRYDEALCLKPVGRLDFGREYSLDEIQAVGCEFTLIRKIG